jgi:hypothetical protein
MMQKSGIMVTNEVREEMGRRRVDGRFASHDELLRDWLGLEAKRALVPVCLARDSRIGRPSKWPWPEMETGDSRLLPWNVINDEDGTSHRAINALQSYRRRTGKAFTTEGTAEGLVVVRIR